MIKEGHIHYTRKRSDIQLIFKEAQHKFRISFSFNFKRFKIFEEDLVGVEMLPSKLCFTDTDSFLSFVEMENFYRDIWGRTMTRQLLKRPPSIRHRTNPYQEDETEGCPIEELVGLRAKLYISRTYRGCITSNRPEWLCLLLLTTRGMEDADIERKLNFQMKRERPSNNTLLSIVTGANKSGEEAGLVEEEEIPETDYPDATGDGVTMVIEDNESVEQHTNKTNKGKQKKKKKKKLVPHADLSSEEEEEKSVTIVNPLHAHLHNNPQQISGKEGESKSLPTVKLPDINMSAKIQSLKDIKETIKSEAGKLGQKLNIKPQQSSGSGKEKDNSPEDNGLTYTIDDAVLHMGMGRYQIAWFILLGMSSMAQASEIALASVILSDLICEWKISVAKASLIPALVLLAALPGGYVGGVIADRRGRKTVIITGQWLILIFGVLSAFMKSYHSFVLIRMVVGFGFGIVTSLVIVHVSEISPPQFRAYSVALNVFMWSVGDCFIVLMGYYSLNYGWSVVVLAACIPALVMCIVILFLDESPRYLSISDNVHEAERILRKMAMINYSTLPPGNLRAVPEPDRGNIRDMFRGDFKKNSLLLLFTVFAANLVYYGNIFSLPYLFKDEYCAVTNSTNLNVSFVDIDCTFSKPELMATLEVSAAEFLSIPIFALLVEKLGRIRTGMILGVATAIFTAACVPCLGLILFKSELFIQRMVVNAWLLLIFIYAPELYPTYVRSAAFGVVMVFCNLGGAFASLIVYDVGLDYSFRAMFLFLSPFALSGAILSFYFKDETKGKFLVDNKKQEDTELKTIADKKSPSQPPTAASHDEEKCCDRQQIAPY
ncbi:hypothetical protein ACHWQZ_G002707 [Mnemiopsis leidyi]